MRVRENEEPATVSKNHGGTAAKPVDQGRWYFTLSFGR